MQLSNESQTKAEDLFICVSTVSEYLSGPKAFNPDGRFKSSLDPIAICPVSLQMQRWTSPMLKSCEWSDKKCVDMYQLVVGSIMALKTPLSASALQALYHHKLQISQVLRLLNSLFIGSSDEKPPVRILHLSFCDFVTYHSRSIPGLEQYWVDERAHNQRLAFRCLLIVNDELSKDIPGTGYLSSDAPYGS